MRDTIKEENDFISPQNNCSEVGFIVWPFVWPRCYSFVSFLFATVNYLIFAYKRYFSDTLTACSFLLKLTPSLFARVREYHFILQRC